MQWVKMNWRRSQPSSTCGIARGSARLSISKGNGLRTRTPLKGASSTHVSMMVEVSAVAR